MIKRNTTSVLLSLFFVCLLSHVLSAASHVVRFFHLCVRFLSLARFVLVDGLLARCCPKNVSATRSLHVFLFDKLECFGSEFCMKISFEQEAGLVAYFVGSCAVVSTTTTMMMMFYFGNYRLSKFETSFRATSFD